MQGLFYGNFILLFILFLRNGDSLQITEPQDINFIEIQSMALSRYPSCQSTCGNARNQPPRSPVGHCLFFFRVVRYCFKLRPCVNYELK